MKKFWLLLLTGGLMIASCSPKNQNPFFETYNTPFQTPPFDKIRLAHYLPAIQEGIQRVQQEIETIANNPEAPTFENTIAALDYSGELLRDVTAVFQSQVGANTNDSLQQIAQEVSPLLSKSSDDILLNAKLFQRIKTIYEQKESLNLNPEQSMLLEKSYKDFVRGGANLDEAQKNELREINKELSLLTLNFGENILKESNKFELIIDNQADLAGLPEAVVTAAAEAATERGKPGKWVFTLHKHSLIPFLQYSQKRELREKIFKAYINCGDNNDELDNKANLMKIVALRIQKANLLGYPTHAHFILEKNMAKVPENVYGLLNKLWQPALNNAQKEAQELQQMITQEGSNFNLEAWDWWYYAEKLKLARYALDEAELRPYFQLENVRNGAFDVAHQLWGITFTKRTDIPKYHEDVEVFEVKEANGKHIGLLYTDYFPRASKRGGAWMDAFRSQYQKDGQMFTPIIFNVGNFTKPTTENPSLLNLEEVTTLFHEFGHALHGLLSNCTYLNLSGTNVAWDFVELPSQIMENWATEPAVLKKYARHFQTNEPIPDELIAKIEKSGKFNQGFTTVEYLAAAFLDMDWHTLTTAPKENPTEFENISLQKIGLIPEIVVRYRSSYFRHIFSGGYSAGYYSYIWAEVLDADAFQAFKETSLFDPATAQALREHIFSKGGTEDPMVLYKRFRGAEPKIEPILERRGLN